MPRKRSEPLDMRTVERMMRPDWAEPDETPPEYDYWGDEEGEKETPDA